MTSAVLKFTACAMLAFSLCNASANEAEHPAEKRKFNLPPSANLGYSIQAQQSGLQLSGNAVWKWVATDSTFKIDTETRAMLVGKILDAKSEGEIDDFGLAPTRFTDKRFRKDATTTTFNHDSKLISFSTNADTYPIKGGEQDRNSAIWELIAVARGAHGKFKDDTVWDFFVAGQHDAEVWSFKVDKQESIRTPMGNLSAVHVVKLPAANSKGQQVDIWLAPSLEWYPVRLRYTEPNGDYVEQMLNSIVKSGE
ncbi:MAG TPA: DUF3108 domain-containing protein [Burkholderiaceae bacterium]|jgi:hypothetical protein|nr:DUF3108 domain-containing protein [Burkholderiaceae bacterium]